MLQLMKYEFRKQMFSKIIILAILGLMELVFVGAVIFQKENLMGVSVLFLYILACLAAFYVSIEVIITFSNDLRTKQSYMLFLTPNNAYHIMGAKVLCAIIQIFLTGTLFLTVGFIDIFFLAARYNVVNDLINSVNEIMNNIIGMDISFSMVIMSIVMVFLFWIATVIFAMMSITLSTTLLENRKFKWIISFLTFVLVNIVVYRIIGLVNNQITVGYNVSSLVSMGLTVVFIAIASIGTSWMLDKKISL